MSESRELPLADVTAGAVLADAVRDGNGVVLLPAGLAITENHLESLRRRGIAFLRVAVPADPAELEARRHAARARVMHLFRHAADAPAAQALLHTVLALREEQLK